MSYNTLETSQRSGAPLELYKFQLDPTTFSFLTSGDASDTYLTDTYTPEAVSRTRVKEGNEPDSGSVVVTLPRTHPVAQRFIGYAPEPSIKVTIYARHRGDAEVVEVFRGSVSTSKFSGPGVELTCLPDIAADDHVVPSKACGPQCQWALYSSGCGKSKVDFMITGTVNVVTGDTVQSTAFSSQPTGWLNNGWIERATGERRWIIDHVGATITLMNPFLGLVPGEVVTAYAGCDRTEAVCDSKFNNHARFLGFPRVPTRNPFDVGVT